MAKQQLPDGLYALEGTFEVDKKGVMITDPCYSSGDLKTALKPGKYRGFVRFYTEKDWGQRNASLIVASSFLSTETVESLSFSEELGHVGVDSGQVGIYDLGEWSESKPWSDDYGVVCESTLKTFFHAGCCGYGVTSSSGYGDGSYNVFGHKDDKGTIDAIKVVFIAATKEERIHEWTEMEDAQYGSDDDTDDA